MGCGNAKQIQVAPANMGGNAVQNPNINSLKTNEGGAPTKTSSCPNTPSMQKKWAEPTCPGTPTLRKRLGKDKKNSWMGSQESLGGRSTTSAVDRNGSATSKMSKHSCDSGLGLGGEAEADPNWIDENSDPEKVQSIMEGWKSPRDLDLGVVGRACPQRLSAKDKGRQEEKNVLLALQEEGLITRPMSRAAGGLTFEITQDDPLVRRPPPRLAKLEKRRKKKKVLTEDEIQRKLEKAEERRKQQEQEKLERIQTAAQKSDVQSALDSFMQMQKEKDAEVKTKEEIAAENREKRFAEMREKMRAKKEHAEMVRKRKKLAPLDGQEADELPPTGLSIDASVDASVAGSVEC